MRLITKRITHIILIGFLYVMQFFEALGDELIFDSWTACVWIIIIGMFFLALFSAPIRLVAIIP